MKVTEGLFCAKLKDVLCIHDLILLYDILPYYCYYGLLYTFEVSAVWNITKPTKQSINVVQI